LQPPTMSAFNAVVVPAANKAKQTAAFIFFHGMGDQGASWATMAENFRLRRKFDDCAFIFPNAPSIPMTINMGMKMPGWFDLSTLSDESAPEDEKGMNASKELIHGMIKEQIDKGIPSERIVVGGFSQGGVVSILAALTAEYKLGGLVCMSTWLPMRKKIADMKHSANSELSVFQAHGELDYVVRYVWGEKTRDALKELGHPVEWHSYPNLDHSADPQELLDLEKWLEKRIPTQS